ncbi:hypothetical protein DFH09DRAFT_1318147 [Mycena vulgaris]|nr:hypothetical protein DFH09DRAFT_1318147 [Mycena vulgaris]
MSAGVEDARTAAAPLVDLFMSRAVPCGAEVVIAEIYEKKTPAFAAWKKDGGLCSACLDKLIDPHLHLWLSKPSLLWCN